MTPVSPVYRTRRGTTLTEVLMSLMIMSIGVVSIATLFPLSAARAIRAAHLTNATILRYNAEAIVDANPFMIFDPDADGTLGTPNRVRHYMVDPLGFEEFRPMSALDPSVTNAERTFGNRVPTGVTFPLPARYPGLSGLTAERARNLVSLPDTTTDLAEGFAVASTSTQVTLESTILLENIDTGIDRFRVVIFDLAGDHSEVRELEDINHDGAIDSNLGEADFSGDGVLEDVQIDVSASTVTWTTPLPARFAGNVGRVLLERPNQFYTWMLSVRARASGPANVDVVVFFKRGYSLDSEQVYVADFRRFAMGPDGAPGIAGVDDNGNTVDDDVSEIGYPLTDDQPNNKVIIQLDPTLYTSSTTPLPRPELKRGGYLFDTRNSLWYRIRDFVFEDVDGDGIDEASVTLEESIRRDSTEDLNDDGTLSARMDIDIDGDGFPEHIIPPEDRNGDGAIDRGGVIVPVGAMSVFPLKTKVQQ